MLKHFCIASNIISKKELRIFYKAIRSKKKLLLEKNIIEKRTIYNNIKNNLLTIIDKENSNLKKENLTIAIYYPIQDEIDIISMINDIIQNNLQKSLNLCLPKMSFKSRLLKFYEYKNDNNELIMNRFKIMEPDPKKCKEVIPDIIITPLLAFDCFKYRLGYGKGCYDNTFIQMNKENINFISIGVAYEELFYNGIFPREEHDQTLNYIITPLRII
jgi:5-formyltetrahydrofolate cyclo-ligase